jgi:NAD(P)-dependent dehydrogenase (short-subunit alcohol dehydrogenase family)
MTGDPTMNDTKSQLIDFPKGYAWVIGGTGGIGQALCRRLVQSACPVVLTYRQRREPAEALVEQLKQSGVDARCYQLSLADTDNVAKVFATMVKDCSRIHSVFNATGADIAMRYIGQVTSEEFRKVIEDDLLGFFHMIQQVIPHFRANHGGSLVTISSAGLYRYPVRDILSVAPKAGIDVLMTGIAREEGRFGIRANTVALGVIEAGIFHRLQGTDFDETWVEQARQNTALKRFGKAEEVAETAVFLASQRASYVTGQTLVLDGGYSLLVTGTPWSFRTYRCYLLVRVCIPKPWLMLCKSVSFTTTTAWLWWITNSICFPFSMLRGFLVRVWQPRNVRLRLNSIR